MKQRLRGLLSLVLLLTGYAASATTYYVATNGSDSNPGTQSQPFLTVQKCANVVAAGDTCLFADGTYNVSANVTINTNGTSAAPITFRSQNVWGATISGAAGVIIMLDISGNYVTIQDFVLTNIGSSASGGSAISNYHGGTNLKVIHNKIYGVGNTLCTGTSNGYTGLYLTSGPVLVDRNWIYSIGREASGGGCSPGNNNYQNHDHGIYIDGGTGYTIQNNLFFNNERGWSIQLYSNQINELYIINNTFADANPWKEGHIIFACAVSTAVVYNNVSYDPTSAFIYTSGIGTQSGVYVEDNYTTAGEIADTSPSGWTMASNIVNSNASTMFVDPTGDTDFHLSTGSQLINAGVSSLHGISAPAYDLENNTRPQGTAFDIGAYESVGNAYYVATIGSDSNPGSQSQPFLTVQKCANVAVAGDTCLFADGTYNISSDVTMNTSGTSAAPITFKSQNVWGATFSGGSGVVAMLSVGGNYITIQDLILTTIGSTNGGETVSNNAGGTNLKVINNKIYGVGNTLCTGASDGYNGIYLSAGPVTVDRNWIYNIGREAPGQGGCNPPNNNYQNHDHGVYISGWTGFTVQNNLFYDDERGWPIQLYPNQINDLYIINNTFADANPWQDGHIVWAAPIATAVVFNNVSYDPTTSFINTGGIGTQSGVYVEHNYTTAGEIADSSTPSGWTVASNNVSSNGASMFVNPTDDTDFHLSTGSQLIDAGVSSLQGISAPAYDLDNNTRPQGTAFDIGAYEGAGSTGSAACLTSNGSWWNAAFAQQNSSFTAQFDATPGASGSGEDGVFGLSSGTANAFTTLAAIARFNTSGFIDARNGGSYTADNSIPYSANTSYHFTYTVNLASRTYSAYVSSPSASAQVIGSNYAFRTEQSTVAVLNNFGFIADIGSATVCNIAVSTGAAPSITSISPSSATAGGSGFTLTVYGANFITGSSTAQWNASNRTTTFVSSSTLTASISAGDIASAGTAAVTVVTSSGTSNSVTFTIQSAGGTCQTSVNTWMNAAFAQQNGTFAAEFDATPGASGSSEDGVFGLSSGTANAFTTLAAIARFNDSGFIDARDGGSYLRDNVIPYSANISYHFTYTVNIASHTYSAYVSSPSAAAQVIGSNYAFRTEQDTVTVLNNLGFIADIGSATVCNITISTWAPPSITSISPSSATAGGSGFTLTVYGTNFTSSSTVQWNASNRTTTFVSGSTLTASIPASDIASAGTAAVTVVTSGYKGGASNSATFTIQSVRDTYYVATTGSDSNSGTQSQPFLTFQKCANVALSGDTCLFADGTYNVSASVTMNTNGTSTAPITFRSENAWGAIISGASGVGDLLAVGGNYVTIQDFVLTNIGTSASGGSAVSNYHGGTNLKVIHNKIYGVGNTICTGTGNAYVGIYLSTGPATVDRNWIYGIGREASGGGCSPGNNNYQKSDHGIYIQGGTGFTVQNNLFYNNERGWSIELYPNQVNSLYIINNTFADANPWEDGHIGFAAPVSTAVVFNNVSYIPTTSFINTSGIGTQSGVYVEYNYTTGSEIADSSTPSGWTVASNVVNSSSSTMFVDPASDTDFHLSAGSQLIDAGVSSLHGISAPAYDLDANVRPQGSAFDVGAYESVK